MSKKRIDELINGASRDLVNEKILKHTVQIFEKKDGKMTPYGSGVLVKSNEHHFLFSASHVLEGLEEKDLFIQVWENRYIPIAGTIRYSVIEDSEQIDLAYTLLDPGMIPDIERAHQFLGIGSIRQTINTDSRNYLACGYPTKNMKYEGGILKTGASFYLTNASNNNPYKFNKRSKEHFLIVEMKGKGTSVDTGSPTKIDSNFYGISGGGVWEVKYDIDEELTTCDTDVRLVGILSEFRKGKYHCLIAVKMENLMKALERFEKLKLKRIEITKASED